MAKTFGLDSERILRVGDRRWPIIECELVDLRLPDAMPFNVRRVQVAFENTWALSIIWGSCTRSSNEDHPLFTTDFVEEPTTVEVAVFHADEILGDPMQRVTAEQVNICLDRLAILPSDLHAASLLAKEHREL